MFQKLNNVPNEVFLNHRDINDWTPEVLLFGRKEGVTFLEAWRQMELGWSREYLAKLTQVPMAVIEAWEQPNTESWLLDQAAESLGLPRWLMDRTVDDYPWLKTI
tara:strand:- start:208 stop:522 length:315 start_codon:yes stop_codon:yes gene_type:complete